ncbi:MAG TPA: apolipoprotein N-acyltransferase, partial [Candidatus Omnitrophota bacterium]|nr:apolipoprotein N-acyltransferase [Candidatus Omnitrophota bacterium]
FFVLGYGYYKLLHYRLSAIGYRLKVSVIQGNIPQELKWRSDSKDYIMNKYLNLTRMSSIDKPDLILWPEASLPVVLEEEPGFIEEVRSFAKEIKIPLLIGAVTKREGIYYNSAILFSAAGESLGRYDKLHLVPFGEYIPLKKYLPFLETIVPIGDINKGEEYTLFKLPITNYQLPITFSTLICFEDLFPELSREFVKRGAGFLVNITNDAWYKKTSAPYQHLQASVFRAIENRVFLARAANTGVSGFIAPSGKIISLVQGAAKRNIFIDGYQTQSMDSSGADKTFYTRYGDIFIILCVLILLCGIIIKFKNQNAKVKITIQNSK